MKIEHPVTGDAQRGLVKVLGAAATVPGSSFAPIMEAPNRGKRSVGLALDNSEARPLLDELIRRSDVFLTNYLPSTRKKLSIDVDDVRRINPAIIYLVGSGFGLKGPDRDAGALSMLQPTRYWPEFCRVMGLHDVAEDPRFITLEAMVEHSETAQQIVADAIGNLSFAECQALLRKGRGQWAPVQDAWEIANDEALTANGRIVEIVDAEGHPQKLVASPVRFDDDPASLTRAPQFAEHTDAVLRELGIDDDRLIELKVAGAIT